MEDLLWKEVLCGWSFAGSVDRVSWQDLCADLGPLAGVIVLASVQGAGSGAQLQAQIVADSDS